MADFRINNWNEWVDFCIHYNEDPYEIIELGFDLGGGNSDTVYFIGDTPKKEEK